jgi:hypothetical protein
MLSQKVCNKGTQAKTCESMQSLQNPHAFAVVNRAVPILQIGCESMAPQTC